MIRNKLIIALYTVIGNHNQSVCGVKGLKYYQFYTSYMSRCQLSTYTPESEYKKQRKPSRAEQILSDVAEEAGVSEEEALGLMSVESRTFDNIKELMVSNREEVMERERLKRLAMERKKYLKPVPMDNLLTWSAKEQIRHLHKHDPQYWTVPRLAESFPCDIKHIKTIIGNKHIMYSKKDIDEHDEKVRDRWNKIANGEYDTLCSGTVKMLSKKPDSMQNSDGIKSLPLSTPITAPVSEVPLTKGLFSTIIKDYLKLKGSQVGTGSESNGTKPKTKVSDAAAPEKDGPLLVSGDGRFVSTKKSAEALYKDETTVYPDRVRGTRRSYNIGYLQAPHRGQARREKRVTFGEYKRLNPGVIAGQHQYNISGSEGDSASERDFVKWRQEQDKYSRPAQNRHEKFHDGSEANQIKRTRAMGGRSTGTSDTKHDDKRIDHTSYFKHLQQKAQQLLETEKSQKKVRMKKPSTSVFNVPNFVYSKTNS